MITTKNFEDLLKALEFEKEGNTYQKSIGEATLKVDIDKKELIYPEEQGLKVNERQTCNFLQNENFVVFECVYQLLKKGYKPEHLELEPRWQVGHGASGGRADILVRDHENNPLLLIECKTAGEEFERAWRKTLQNGDQLFSYAQQIPQTQYLCLYASDLVDDKIRDDQRIIAHRDNEKILVQNDNLRPFADATDVEDRYAIWCETYEQEFTTTGIFEENIQPYNIGKNKFTLEDDTKEIDATDADKDKGKYHRFRTILRQHNIARREQAFEVLVNLFLCKLVDEEDNKTDLKFSWKGIAYDNYFDFVDRLQNLYKTGMNKFLGKTISYISNEQIDKAFWAVKNDTNQTKKKIQDYFRELKYYTNSAFSLMDTHNEELFKRNAKVLLELVQMWQEIRLKTDDQNQFLGEMFELFLDDGVKQSEGQFFTPLPICKFIVSSLPLAQKIEEKPEPLKAIDFACGSGHFLNEYAHQIMPLVEKQKRELYYSHITGIEKEDRLAKVAKVAAFMHGQGQIKILDTDALIYHLDEVPLGSFDVLVANPPFAVKEFLHTLSKDDKKEYQLIQATGEDSDTNTIQCFFLERIHHLMAPDGVVGVIVPSSILSNADAVHIRTREILLQFFDLVSIAQLGSGTFGKTGTNTVVLFLKRKEPRPEPADQYRNRVKNFFDGDEEKVQYQDHDLIQAYCNHIEIPYEEYIKLFAQTSLEPLSDLMEHDIFQDYKQAFGQSTDIKNLKKSNVFKKKTPTEQSAEIAQRLIGYLHAIEKDKLYYFMLAHTQAGKVLIVNAPSDKKEQKQFLGYEWSKAKGREGIKYNGGDTVNDIITPLFAPKDLDNDTKINTAIKRNFIGEITDPLPEHCHYANLTDMLDFSRIDFNKVINLNPKQNIDIETKWDLVKLGKVVETQYGYTANAEDEGDVRYLRITDITEDGQLKNTDKKYINPSEQIIQDYTLKTNDIVIARSGSTGRMLLYKGIDEHLIFASYLVRLKVSEEILPEYIFAFHKTTVYWKQVGALTTTLAQPNLNAERMKQIKIPLPPLEVQRKITDECEAVDQETDEARQTITETEQTIEEKVQAVINAGHEMKNIDRVLTLEYGISLPGRERNSGEFPVYGSNGVVGSHNEFVVNAPCIIVGRKGSAGEVNWSDKNCTPIDTTFYVELLDETTTDLKFIYHMLKSLNLPSLKGGSGPGGINRNNVYSIQIPVPPLDIQQQLVAEVEQLEAKITDAQAVLDNATDRKNTILTTHL